LKRTYQHFKLIIFDGNSIDNIENPPYLSLMLKGAMRKTI